MTIGFIGCGNMGGALLAAFQRQKEHALLATDRDPAKVAALGVGIYRPLSALLTEADVILLATKPQSFAALAAEIGAAAREKLVISIMAGVPIARLSELTGAARVVRCMPNLPVAVGQGVLGWYGENLTAAEEACVAQLFQLAGTAIQLASEQLVAKITLISGCGPAYFAYFAELLQREAERLGFTPAAAAQMVTGTLQGTACLLTPELTPHTLRTQVTSPGGVTEAVINQLEKDALAAVFAAGIAAGQARLQALSQK